MNDFIFHGHFYQPPRENPWTEGIPLDRDTAPFHDWNARIHSECYRANAAARICRDDGRIESLLNNYEQISFNFGPTLIQWLERHDPHTLARIVDADRRSLRAHAGHGNALAQVYNHIIMPLANPDDRRTQILWGLASFTRTFGRSPEGMWLAECAASHAVLDDLIEHDLRLVILSPQQAKRVRASGGEWRDVSDGSVDSTRAYRYLHGDGGGRSIAVFFYDGALASDVSFGDALKSSANFEKRVREAAKGKDGALVHVAVDGETLGHHVKWGDRALAHAIQDSLSGSFVPRNYGEMLELAPPTEEVELEHGPLGEGSAWSCAHGVGRWVRDCGCRLNHEVEPAQAWRGPLRSAFDLVRDRSRALFVEQGGGLFRDPWQARDDAIELVLSTDPRVRSRFFERHVGRELSDADTQRALVLLEMQRQLLLMYTSCGWFFDDIAGIEAVQCMRHAARAMELWSETGATPPTEEVLDTLADAESADSERGSGADVFRQQAMTARVNPRQIALAVGLRVARSRQPVGQLDVFRFEVSDPERAMRPGWEIMTANVAVEHTLTLARDELQVAVVRQNGETPRVFASSPVEPSSLADVRAALSDLPEESIDGFLVRAVSDAVGPEITSELAAVLESTEPGPVDLERLQELCYARFLAPEGVPVTATVRALLERMGFVVDEE